MRQLPSRTLRGRLQGAKTKVVTLFDEEKTVLELFVHRVYNERLSSPLRSDDPSLVDLWKKVTAQKHRLRPAKHRRRQRGMRTPPSQRFTVSPPRYLHCHWAEPDKYKGYDKDTPQLFSCERKNPRKDTPHPTLS